MEGAEGPTQNMIQHSHISDMKLVLFVTEL